VDLIDAGTRLDRLPLLLDLLLLDLLLLDAAELDEVELHAAPNIAMATRAPPTRKADRLLARRSPSAGRRPKWMRNLLLLTGCFIVIAPFSLV